MALLSVFCCTATAATSTIVGFWISMIIQALKRSNKDII
ncbi:WSSV106 [White spot syndrome virus]|nr:WSSV106 [White spot syndrome virus]